MDNKNSQEHRRWRVNMQVLKWATIALPIIFLVSLDLLRHSFFYGRLHTLSGFVATYTVIALAVVIFSFSIFGFISRLQRRTIDQNRHLSALNDIVRASAGSLGLEDTLYASLKIVVANMNVDSGVICLVDAEKEEHALVCYIGLSPEVAERIQKRRLRDEPIGLTAVRTGRPVIIERVCEDTRVTEAAKREGVKSIISAPLKFEGEVNGILAISTRTERHFSDADQEFLESIAGQLGMVIRNEQLYQRVELHNRELGALLAVGKAVTSSLELGELLDKSLDTIIEVMPINIAEIWLVDGEEGLIMKCHRGAYREAFLEQTRFRMGEGMPGIVAQSRQPILVHNLPEDDRFLRKEAVKAGFHTLCALPLFFQKKLVGVMLVAALSANVLEGQRELRLLEGLGEWLAIAIENARLYQQVQDMAILQERERLAREMHDGMAQLLGYINTQTMAVKKLLSNGQLSRATEELARMETIARDLYADAREIILGLRTTAIGEDGLLPALRRYAERYTEMTGIQVEFGTNGGVESPRLPSTIEIQLLRIVQESLTNIRKHAKATEAKVTFQRNDSQIRVTIADNGQGFESTHLPLTGRPRFGLQTMRERAEALGGSLIIDSATGQGTRVEVCIPLAAWDGQVLSYESSAG
ncbi:MAG: GAF domain-containing sensor histidine kinase [Dehalococcoidales bacterium]|nr:GAF domain-containing sensor histidine kinase [Dehalococcoidales bacterium]